MRQAFEYERLARSLVPIELQEASQPADSPAIGIGGVLSEAENRTPTPFSVVVGEPRQPARPVLIVQVRRVARTPPARNQQP